MPHDSDVVIIGGGITGITSAYLLAREGKRVVLMEKEKLGEGATAYTTGFLTQVIDIDPARMIKAFGIEKAKLILASHREAIDAIEKIIETEKIECEFARCANYIYANSSKEEKDLLKMVEAFRALGVSAEYKKDTALKFSNAGYIEIPNQAKFNAAKYVSALADRAKKYGAEITEGVEVKDIGSIKAENVLVATYAPFDNPPHLAHRGNMYRSYVLEYKVPAGAFVEAIYQDSLEPYHYFRVDREEGYDRILFGGADDLDVIDSDSEINFQVLREYMKKLLRESSYEETHHWSGRILTSIGGLPYIGATKDSNIFYAFGFSGNGMTYSYIASKIFTDQLMSRANPYAVLYVTDRETSWWARVFN